MIWGRKGALPRLPPIIYSCKEAKNELSKHYVTHTISSKGRPDYKLVFDPEQDIVYRKCELPMDLTPWTFALEAPDLRIEDIPQAKLPWTYCIKSLALNLDDVDHMFDANGSVFVEVLKVLCRHLEELVVVCGRKFEQGMSCDEMKVYHKKMLVEYTGRHLDVRSTMVDWVEGQVSHYRSLGLFDSTFRVRFVERRQ